MRIIRSKRYTLSLQNIVSYISQDSRTRALNFKNELDKIINDLANMPYKFRPSIYFEDKSKRDLIFKGYIITIIGIKKYQNSL